MSTEILSGNILKFIFDDINLPPDWPNEIESHGYVIFEVTPINNLSHNEEIKNSASIYFDFNPPILTNSVINTIFKTSTYGSLYSFSCTSMSVSEISNGNSVIIKPNPFDNLITLDFDSEYSGRLEIISITGDIIKKQEISSSEIVQVDLDNLKTGMYIIRLVSNVDTKTFRIMKN